MEQVEEDYTVGERVEAQDHMRNTWYPGTIDRIGSYDVRSNTTGRTMNRAREEVRDPVSHQIGEFINLRVGSPVEIEMARDNWVPGILLKKYYSVRLDRDGGRIAASHTEIRRPGNAPAPTPEQAAAIRAAFEQQEAVRRAEAEQRVAQQMREERRLAEERQAEERRQEEIRINQIYSEHLVLNQDQNYFLYNHWSLNKFQVLCLMIIVMENQNYIQFLNYRQ